MRCQSSYSLEFDIYPPGHHPPPLYTYEYIEPSVCEVQKYKKYHIVISIMFSLMSSECVVRKLI